MSGKMKDNPTRLQQHSMQQRQVSNRLQNADHPIGTLPVTTSESGSSLSCSKRCRRSVLPWRRIN